jgi:hypothetical protein
MFVIGGVVSRIYIIVQYYEPPTPSLNTYGPIAIITEQRLR